jgi:2-dehydropantoate 2-reductase
MRFVIYGAGAVGNAIGARLAVEGADVTLIARGAAAPALRERGVSLVTPAWRGSARPRVVEHPREIAWTGDEIAIVAVKSQDTAAVLDALAGAAPPSIEVVCAQNGVANEPAALRRFPRVISMYVWMPAEQLEPGAVRIYAAPQAGILDVGRYPRGVDAPVTALARALALAPFEAEARPDIMAWKYRKLVWNLNNAVDALCGTTATDEARELVRRAWAEGDAVLAAAGIAAISDAEEAARRGDRFSFQPIDGAVRSGGSTWQSLARATGSIEIDYLNGEIVLLGRLHGVATPVNELLQRAVNEAARDRRPPGSVPPAELLGRLGALS